MAFKPRTVFPDYNIPLNNFKGHHQKALSKLGHLAPQLDLVLEIRDCRAPVSTTNVLFDKVLARKKKLILYSKKDLSILNSPLLDKWHKPRNEEYMFVDCRSPVDATRVIKKLRNLYNKMDMPPPLGLRTMIVGMPNVGKSSMVNLLRQVGLERDGSTKFRKVARTGHQPGVTRNTSEIIRISQDPDILMYDTPGVFVPTARNVETMLALGLIHWGNYTKNVSITQLTTFMNFWNLWKGRRMLGTNHVSLMKKDWLCTGLLIGSKQKVTDIVVVLMWKRLGRLMN
ncbi:hypothetical protein G210_0760 [Candida maltosa Xu316]|uniref:G domain-containing protein n=1 Tax=Candida maltosa (strain Xu316) TaxID=1245528 RepID=M3K1R0_CANMX|nr:hypothetical protein G210_0760 [Candida maltosa Xu316]